MKDVFNALNTDFWFIVFFINLNTFLMNFGSNILLEISVKNAAQPFKREPFISHLDFNNPEIMENSSCVMLQRKR